MADELEACTVSYTQDRIRPIPQPLTGRWPNSIPYAVLDLGKIVKDSVQKQGMLPWQYNTIGVSDAITMVSIIMA